MNVDGLREWHIWTGLAAICVLCMIGGAIYNSTQADDRQRRIDAYDRTAQNREEDYQRDGAREACSDEALNQISGAYNVVGARIEGEVAGSGTRVTGRAQTLESNGRKSELMTDWTCTTYRDGAGYWRIIDFS